MVVPASTLMIVTSGTELVESAIQSNGARVRGKEGDGLTLLLMPARTSTLMIVIPGIGPVGGASQADGQGEKGNGMTLLLMPAWVHGPVHL